MHHVIRLLLAVSVTLPVNMRTSGKKLSGMIFAAIGLVISRIIYYHHVPNVVLFSLLSVGVYLSLCLFVCQRHITLEPFEISS